MLDLPELERRMIATKAALDGARAAHRHSPNGETAMTARRAETMLNHWLDMWIRQTTADRIVDDALAY